MNRYKSKKVTEDRQEPARTKTEIPNVNIAKSAILCVDDERTVLQSLKTQLKKNFGANYRYELAESVEEAWEIIEELSETHVELLIIVSDWLMPDMKGDDFLVEIHARFPHVITVLLTGQANEEAIEHARREANLHRCLYKPWSEQELIEAIVSGLRER